jgi:hypothetical protein
MSAERALHKLAEYTLEAPTVGVEYKEQIKTIFFDTALNVTTRALDIISRIRAANLSLDDPETKKIETLISEVLIEVSAPLLKKSQETKLKPNSLLQRY